nr:transporter [uncultured Rhodoferax sp.]
MSIKSNLISVPLCLLAATGVAHAVENGAPITPIGVFTFGAGMMPPPSDLPAVALRYENYESSDLRDNSGNEASNKSKIKVDSLSVALIKTTDIDLFGGKYGFAAVIPTLNMSNDLFVRSAGINLTGKTQEIGDITITPVIVGWTPSPGLFTNASLQLQFPTGGYNKDRIINAGSNHSTVSPTFAFTYITPGGYEISSSIQVNFHDENTATKYTSGNEYQHEFAVGKHIGSWTVGLGGYHYQQITPDTGAGTRSGTTANSADPANLSRVTALGPVVNFFELGSGMPMVSALLYREFNAVNRAQGTKFAINAAWTF